MPATALTRDAAWAPILDPLKVSSSHYEDRYLKSGGPSLASEKPSVMFLCVDESQARQIVFNTYTHTFLPIESFVTPRRTTNFLDSARNYTGAAFFGAVAFDALFGTYVRSEIPPLIAAIASAAIYIFMDRRFRK